MTLGGSHIARILRLQHLSADDLATVSETIRAHEQTIVDIDKQINTLNREITLLRTKKQEHLNKITHCKGIVTLARRLPPEVIASIIEHCSTSGWWRAPQVLSRVSSAYFQASRLPRVWSRLYIECEDADVLPRTKFWLFMAQKSLLDIRIRTGPNTTIVDKVLSLLFASSAQWRSFALETSNVEEADVALSRWPPSVPNLREFSINTQESPEGVVDLSRLGTMVGACSLNLRKLAITCNSLDSVVILPSRIEHLHITLNAIALDPLISVRSVCRVLRMTVSSLQEFTLNIAVLQNANYPQHQALASVPILELPVLQRVSLHTPAEFFALLETIAAPLARHLRLQASGEPRLDPHKQTGEALAIFTTNAASCIQQLELYDIDIPDQSFVTCFQNMSELEELRLHWTDISDEAVCHLASGRICPKLKSLDLRWCSQLTGKAVVDVVRQRSAAPQTVSRIEVVTILNCSFVEESDVLALAEMTKCRLTLLPYGDPCSKSGGRTQCFLLLTLLLEPRGCCSNIRYRQRFHLRHFADLTQRNVVF
jgi:hypothetical protein